MTKKLGQTIALFLLCLPSLFLSPPVLAAPGPLRLFVSIPPQAFVAKQIGREFVEVHTLVSRGQDPHTFEPSPGQVLFLGKTQLYFTIGMPFEQRLVAQIAPPRLAIVDTSRGLQKRAMDDSRHAERAGAHEQHRHAGEPDPHVWLSPPLLKTVGRNMLQAMVTADPAHARPYRQNYQRFSRTADVLHARITALLKPYAGRTFYVFHPAFGYFADTYGLKQKAVETGGKTPTPKQLARLVAAARHDRVKVIFVQPQFDPKSADAVARAIDGAVIPMDSLAEDVFQNLEKIAIELRQALH